ncbi:MAG: tetratricopeptide repeat protein [Planctomycetes bacterium]|nr:tetratricopeptide repeat protein [Planctomycetota bacterium]
MTIPWADRRLLVAGLCWSIAALSGCSLATHQERRAEAERRWNEVRAGIKIQLGQEQFHTGNVADALRSAREALAIAPWLPDVYVLLAKAHLERGEAASAERVILSAPTAVGLRDPRLALLLGIICEQREDLGAALRHYREARQSQNAEVDYVVAEAECLVRLGRSGEALALLDDQVDRFDASATVLALAGRIAVLTGDLPLAVDRLGAALRGAPNDAQVRRMYGLLLVEAGRWTEAMGVLEAVATGDRSETADAAVVRGLARCYLEIGRPAEARDILRRCVRTNGGDAQAQWLLARASIETGDWLTAMAALDVVSRQRSGDHDVALLRAMVHWKTGRHSAAADALKKLLSERPKDVDALCLLGEVAYSMGDVASARRHFATALAIKPWYGWADQGLSGLPADAPGPSGPATRN